VTPELAVGDKAPDFALPDDAGRKVKLSDLRGGWVVLTFYAEDDTPVCAKQVCGFRDAFAGFEEADARIFGVSSDPPGAHKAWRAAERIPFPLLSDEANKVAKRYGAHGENVMYGRKVEGVIRTTVIVDPKGKIAVLQRRVRTAGHGARVLEDLRAAQAAYL
jgi:thioredoxin-dependent peroxiredoxin